MSISEVASYGPQIDQSHGENRLRHIIRCIISCYKSLCKKITDTAERDYYFVTLSEKKIKGERPG